MNSRVVSRRVVMSALVILLTVVGWSLTEQPGDLPGHAAQATAEAPAASEQMQWYRGNIHTHSLWSDGDDYPEMIARWYRDHDYQFLCYTDHNVLPEVERWIDVEKSKGGRKAYDKLKAAYPENWVEERMRNERLEVKLKTFDLVSAEFNSPGEFLLIRGEEITDRFKNLPIHMNATNIQSLIPPLHGESVYETMQNNVNAVVSQRERTGEPILIHLNHPNFGYGVTAEDLMRVQGENFFEVYNGHPGVRNSGDSDHASTERMWDIMLSLRLTQLGLPVMYGLAVDDGHAYHNIPSRASEPGRGWVMVQAAELTPAAMVNALEAGRFYSSSGVTLKSVRQRLNGLDVEVEADEGVEYRIDFIGTRQGFDPEGREVERNGKTIAATRIYSDEIGATLKTVQGTKARYDFSGDEVYVRALITSTRKHPNPSEPGEFERAWVQPIVGPAAKQAE